MRETTITNATALGISTSIESLTESEGDVYLKCDGDYYRGTITSGFKKQVQTVTVEGILYSKGNKSGPQEAMKDFKELADANEKTTLKVQGGDGTTTSFQAGKIKRIDFEPSSSVSETNYTLTFETEETNLEKGYDKNKYFLLDPSQYSKIDETFGYTQHVLEKSWDIEHSLTVVPSNKQDYTSKAEYLDALSNHAKAITSSQLAKNYIQQAMLNVNPPFPLDGTLNGILAKAADPDSFGAGHDYVLSYSYSNSYDLICGGATTRKTINLKGSGVNGYEASHDATFERNDAGIVTVSVNGEIQGLKETATKTLLDYAEEGYAVELGLADGRVSSTFNEFGKGGETAPSILLTESKTVTNGHKEGKITYSYIKTNDPKYQDTPIVTVSKSNNVEKGYESLCQGDRTLITTISQEVTVEGCGDPTNAGGGFPKFNNAGSKYDELLGDAPDEIEALYDGDRRDDFKKKMTSESDSPYQGVRSFTMTYSDSKAREGNAGYGESDDCISWQTTVNTTAAQPRYVESETQIGTQIEKKAGDLPQETSIKVQMLASTGDNCGDFTDRFLTKAKEEITEENSSTCFLSSCEWSLQRAVGKPADFEINSTYIG